MSDNTYIDLSTVTNRNTNYNELTNKRMTAEWPPLDNPYVPGAGQKVENWGTPPAQEQRGFPQDDEYSIQCNDGGSANLDIFYNNTFHQNEVHVHAGNNGQECSYLLEHTPVLAGTLTGTIHYLENPDLQIWQMSHTFVASQNGNMVFTAVGQEHNGEVTGGSLNLLTGELKISFLIDNPGQRKVTVSYESNVDPVPEQPVWGQQGKWSTFKKAEDKNSNSYIDYLINQLADTKSRLYDAEEKLEAIHKGNGGKKTIEELEVDMYNEYEKKLKDMKEFFIEKVDQFLKMKVKDEEDLKKMASRPSVEIFEEAISDNVCHGFDGL